MAERWPVLWSVLAAQRRSWALWGLALAVIAAIYIGFYPSLGGDAMDELVESLPDDLVVALGYDQIGSAGGWVSQTVYALLGPVLLLVHGISNGARLFAGEERDGTIELELTAPVSRTRILAERAMALWVAQAGLVAVITVVSWVLVTALDMDVAIDRLLAGSTGLLALTGGFASLALGLGAATGRWGWAVAGPAGLAVVAFMFDALGPVADQPWMTSVSPFSWYLGAEPLLDGFDPGGLVRLAGLTVIGLGIGFGALPRRDLVT